MQLNMLLLAAMAVLLCPYLLRYRAHPAQEWSAPAAWLRAGLYFCFCLLVASVTGALEVTLASPLVYPGQTSDPWWLLATAVVLVFIVAAYWVYWYRNTLRFGRPLALLSQGVFGLCWGFTTGLLFLSFWQLAVVIGAGWPLWLVWLLAYVMISVWQAMWMDMYWDVYVSPEHDSPESIRRKVPRTHIPNMTLCLSYFALYQKLLDIHRSADAGLAGRILRHAYAAAVEHAAHAARPTGAGSAGHPPGGGIYRGSCGGQAAAPINRRVGCGRAATR